MAGNKKLVANVGYITGYNGNSYVFVVLDEDSGNYFPTVIFKKDGNGQTIPSRLHTISIENLKTAVKNKTGAVSDLLDFDQIIDGDDYADTNGYVTVSNVTDLTASKFDCPSDITTAAKTFSIFGDGFTATTDVAFKKTDENNDGIPDDTAGSSTNNALFGLDFSGKLDFLKTKSLTGLGKTWDDVVSFIEKNPVIVAGVVFIGWKPVIMPLFKKIKKVLKF